MSTKVITRTQSLSSLQSLNVVKNAIRSAFSSIAYLRNLFDEDAFEDRQVEDLQLKLLRPRGPEAALVLNWFERGVFDALERKYLRLVAFGIHNNDDDLLECYYFHFTYEGSATAMDVTRADASKRTTTIRSLTKDAARDQTLSLIKSLIVLTQSLTPLPPMHHLSLKLWYYDEKVPPDYEPEFFRPTDPEHRLRFGSIPQDCDIGGLETGEHGVTIKIKTTAEAEEIDDGDDDEQQGRSSTRTCSNPNSAISMDELVAQWLAQRLTVRKSELTAEFKLNDKDVSTRIQRLQRAGLIGRYDRLTQSYPVIRESGKKSFVFTKEATPPRKRVRVA